MSPTKLRLVLAFAGVFSLLTLFEVVTQREDWPLSSYPMYSKLVSPRAVTRTVLVGVSEQGEFPLLDKQTAPYSGARLLSLSKRLAKRPDRARKFVGVLGERYERKRLSERWPVLQAVRSYSEKWVMRSGLAGIDKPARSFDQAMYVPPPALLERLQAEAAGSAAPLAPVRVPQGDRMLELDAASCDDGCSLEADPQAAGGSAIALEGGAQLGSLTTRLRLERGRYALLVRMKVRSLANFDRLFVELDGRRVATSAGLGNYLEALPFAAWLWASQRPGLTALVIDVNTDGEHVLTLSTASKVLVDQLWLRRSVRELPVDTAPRQP